MHLAPSQGFEELILPAEFRHLDIGVTDFTGRMGIAAGRARNIVFGGEVASFSVTAIEQAPGIKHFNDIDLPRQLIQLSILQLDAA